MHRLAATTAFWVGSGAESPPPGALPCGPVSSATTASTTSGTNAPTVPTTLSRSARQGRLRHASTAATSATSTISTDPRTTDTTTIVASAAPGVRREANQPAMAPSRAANPLLRTATPSRPAMASPATKSSRSPAARLSSSVHPGPIRMATRKNSTP